MNKKVTISFFIFALMIGLLFYYKQPGMFQHDMVEYAQYAEYFVLGEYDALYQPYVIQQFPWRTGTVFLTTAMFYLFHLFGAQSAEFATFFTQFFFGAWSIVILYLFLHELYGEHGPAIVGALIFGLSAPLFNGILSKEHGTEFFFACAAMYLLLLAMKQRNTFLLFLSNSCLGLLLSIKESTLFFPIIYYGFFFIYTLEKNEIKQHLTLRNICAVTVPYIILAFVAFKIYVWLLLTTALEKTNALFFSYADEILLSLWQWYPLLFFIIAALATYYGIKEKNKIILFFIFIIVLFFLVFTKNESYDIRHLGIYFFFPLSVIICYGLWKLTASKNLWKKTIIYVFCILLLLQVFLPGVALFEQRKQHVYTEEFGEAIQEIVPKESIILMQHDFCRFFAYYAKRHCKELPDNFFTTVDTFLEQRTPVYVPFHLGFGFYDEATKIAIEQTYNLEVVYIGNFETFHHADLHPQVYEEMLIKVTKKD